MSNFLPDRLGAPPAEAPSNDAADSSADATLRPTFFLDSDHPDIVKFARDVVGTASRDADKAIRLFTAVRETVRYNPYAVPRTPEGYKASAVLRSGESFCAPKAILLAAAARAVGIPSRLGFADVTNHLATEKLLRFLRTDVFAFHGYVALHVDGAWPKVVPAFNAALCRWFGVDVLEFDGVHDAVLQPFTRKGDQFMEYVHDYGLFDDFPADLMVQVWKRTYPHFFDGDTPNISEEAVRAEAFE